MITEDEKPSEENLNVKASEEASPPAAPISHHGDGDIIVHTGEGDINKDHMAELKTLRTKVRLLEELIEEKENCVLIHMKDYEELIEAKNEEVKILKAAIKILKESNAILKKDLDELKAFNKEFLS